MIEHVKRAEGFRGQRLLRLPVDVLVRARKHELLGQLYITDIGCFPESADHLVERPEGSENHILIYGVSGSGWIDVEGHRMAIPPEYALLIPAGVGHSYGADSDIPWSIHWVHFNGEKALAYLRQLGDAGTVQQLYVPAREKVEAAFEQCEQFLNSAFSDAQLLASFSSFTHLLSLLQLHQRASEPRGRSSEERILRSIAVMHERLQEALSIADLAKQASLSVPHYCALFQRQAGSPPMRYFARLKMQHACELLDHTGLPIAEIAAAVGFADQLHFSRRFKKIIGVSPSAYRRLIRG